MPIRSATRATADSPSVCMSRVNPVGANASGSADRAPSSVVDGSTAETSRSTLGRNSTAVERLPGPAQADLRPGGAVGVVEDRARHAPPGDLAEVADGGRAGQPPVGRVARERGAGGSARAAPTSAATGARPRPITLPGGTGPRRVSRPGSRGPSGARGSSARQPVRPRQGRRRPARRSPTRVLRRRQPAGPPAQHVLQPGQPVPRPARAGQLVPLPREEQQLRRDAAALELDVEPRALLDAGSASPPRSG